MAPAFCRGSCATAVVCTGWFALGVRGFSVQLKKKYLVTFLNANPGFEPGQDLNPAADRYFWQAVRSVKTRRILLIRV
jgi:hypothetical protein